MFIAIGGPQAHVTLGMTGGRLPPFPPFPICPFSGHKQLESQWQ